MTRNLAIAASGQAARNLWILAVSLGALFIFWPSLKEAISLAIKDERYLQIALAPLASLFLIFWQRKEIFASARHSPRTGVPLLSVAMLLGLVSVYGFSGSQSTKLLLVIFSMVLLIMAGFIHLFGLRSFREAIYPLSCLFAMIPLLPSWMDQVAVVFQHGSAAISYELLRLTGIPVFRHGMQFALPGLNIEVAPECSGIRSSLAMTMVAIVASYVYLRSGWTRMALIILTIPIVIFKNSVRIVGLTILSVYVDPSFLDGRLHHTYGGLVFSVVGVALLVLTLAVLQKLERASRAGLARAKRMPSMPAVQATQVMR